MNNNFLPYQLKKTNDTNEALATQLAENTSQLNDMVYSVKTFGGAKGDGITDDTTAIQNTVNAVIQNNGGKVFIPRGTYLVSAQIMIDLTKSSWTGNSFEIYGDGVLSVPMGDISTLDVSSTGGLILVKTKDDTTQKVSIRGLSFTKPDSAGAVRYGNFINVQSWRNVRIENCSFNGGDTQVLIQTAYGCSIVRCNFVGFNQAIYLKDSANTTVIDNNVIRNGRKGILADCSLSPTAALGIRIINNYVESLSNEAIYFKAVRFSSIENNYFEAIDQSNTYLTGKQVVVVFDVGSGSNTGQSSARNTIRNNANGASPLLYAWIKAGFYNTFIGDCLTIQDDSGSNLSTQITQDNNIMVGTIQGLTPTTPISVGGAGFGMTAVTSPTFQNNWIKSSLESGNIGYWRDPFGIVHLEGEISSGTMNNVAFNLPVGFRPQHEMKVAVNSNDAFGQLRITTQGDVIPRLGSNVSFMLTGVNFRAYGY